MRAGRRAWHTRTHARAQGGKAQLLNASRTSAMRCNACKAGTRRGMDENDFDGAADADAAVTEGQAAAQPAQVGELTENAVGMHVEVDGEEKRVLYGGGLLQQQWHFTYSKLSSEAEYLKANTWRTLMRDAIAEKTESGGDEWARVGEEMREVEAAGAEVPIKEVAAAVLNKMSFEQGWEKMDNGMHATLIIGWADQLLDVQAAMEDALNAGSQLRVQDEPISFDGYDEYVALLQGGAAGMVMNTNAADMLRRDGGPNAHWKSGGGDGRSLHGVWDLKIGTPFVTRVENLVTVAVTVSKEVFSGLEWVWFAPLEDKAPEGQKLPVPTGWLRVAFAGAQARKGYLPTEAFPVKLMRESGFGREPVEGTVWLGLRVGVRGAYSYPMVPGRGNWDEIMCRQCGFYLFSNDGSGTHIKYKVGHMQRCWETAKYHGGREQEQEEWEERRRREAERREGETRRRQEVRQEGERRAAAPNPKLGRKPEALVAYANALLEVQLADGKRAGKDKDKLEQMGYHPEVKRLSNSEVGGGEGGGGDGNGVHVHVHIGSSGGDGARGAGGGEGRCWEEEAGYEHRCAATSSGLKPPSTRSSCAAAWGARGRRAPPLWRGATAKRGRGSRWHCRSCRCSAKAPAGATNPSLSLRRRPPPPTPPAAARTRSTCHRPQSARNATAKRATCPCEGCGASGGAESGAGGRAKVHPPPKRSDLRVAPEQAERAGAWGWGHEGSRARCCHGARHGAVAANMSEACARGQRTATRPARAAAAPSTAHTRDVYTNTSAHHARRLQREHEQTCGPCVRMYTRTHTHVGVCVYTREGAGLSVERTCEQARHRTAADGGGAGSGGGRERDGGQEGEHDGRNDARDACRLIEMNVKVMLMLAARSPGGRWARRWGWARREGRRRGRRPRGRQEQHRRWAVEPDCGALRLALAALDFALLYVCGDVERHPGPEERRRVMATLNVDGVMRLKGKGGMK